VQDEAEAGKAIPATVDEAVPKPTLGRLTEEAAYHKSRPLNAYRGE
jgi:hypothetical protein